MVYLPLSHPAVKLDGRYGVLRTRGDPASLAPSIRTAVDRADASVPLTLRTMEAIVSAARAQATFTVTRLAIAAGIGLVSGLVGLYDAVSCIASQRGDRCAPGAGREARKRVRDGVWQGALVAVLGIVLGLVAWSSAASWRQCCTRSPHTTPATCAIVATLLMGVCVFAS